jgi:hypothetical protein
MIWNVPELWKGGECWIIGGGTSMPRQFGVPEQVIRDVMSWKSHPSTYSPYLQPIHDKHVIGVNNAYRIGTWIDVCFFGDCHWYLVHRRALASWPGLKVTCCQRFYNRKEKDMEGVKLLTRDKQKRHGISKNKSSVAWNGNSGAAAISLAVHFGVKRIILLGFDMKLDENQVSHWHGAHGKVVVNKKRKVPPFDRHLKGFPEIATDAILRGVEILNASPISKIMDFEKVTVNELLGNTQVMDECNGSTVGRGSISSVAVGE